MKLSKKQITQAVRLYARKHGYYCRTVREVSSLFYLAISEWNNS